MFVKSLGLLTPVAAGALYFGGVFDAGYARELDRPPAQVMAALEDLDVRTQPGEPGTDPSRSGGVAPVFVTEKTADTISFVVMSGNQVATRMTARLEPLAGGTRTRVTALVERGDAPDAHTSPAFQSVGLTMGLFVSALTDELNELESPPTKTAEQCAELMRSFESRPVANGMQAIVRVHEMEAELRRNGCSTRGGGPFQPMEAPAMGPRPQPAGGWGTAAGPSDASPAGWGSDRR